MAITSKPKIAWLNHRGERFPRGSFKSFSYRYTVSVSSAGDAGAGIAPGTAIIETRYRGQSASWSMQPSVHRPEVYTVGGTFVHPEQPSPVESAAPEIDAVSEDRKEALRAFTRKLVARAFKATGATP